MDELKLFNNEEFGSVRAFLKDGEPWFVGKDVADVLGYENGSRDINRHVDKEDRQNYRNGTSELNNRGMTIINESGLYSLIFQSKMPKAKAFKRWVTSEVLPSIRKTGGYGSRNDGDDTIALIQSTAAATAAAVVERLPWGTLNAIQLSLNSDFSEGKPSQKIPDSRGKRDGKEPFQLTNLQDQPKTLTTDVMLEEVDFWESLLKEWRRFRTFIRYKTEADRMFLALCHDKYPDILIGMRTLYKKWRDYERKGRFALVDMRGRHGHHHCKNDRNIGR